MPTKTELRAEMRARLRDAKDDRAKNSRALCTALIRRPDYQGAQTVALFDPLQSEPDVNLLWQLAPRRFFYPRIVEERLAFHEVDDVTELKPSVCGLSFREPPAAGNRLLEIPELDIILVPGLAFSSDGRRLGRGGGFYDRFLATLSPRTTRLGVCFSFQLVDDLPTESHDERVTAVVTN
jgi:5-formyltetrahydrofolate cyclo-ligase